jgi:hypothetical protein
LQRLWLAAAINLKRLFKLAETCGRDLMTSLTPGGEVKMATAPG